MTLQAVSKRWNRVVIIVVSTSQLSELLELCPGYVVSLPVPVRLLW